MVVPCFIQTYIVPATPLLAALLVYILGRRTYFRQKEYELITARYIDQGIDAVSRNVDRLLAVFRHNWWQSTVVLKHFRDLGKDTPEELYEKPYIPPDPSLYDFWRDYRLADIVGDDIFNRAHQLLDAFVKTSYAFFQHDLGSMVRVTIKGGKELEVSASREEMVESYLAEIDRLNTEVRRFYVLLGELQKLSSLLQTERFTFATLPKIRNRAAVKAGIANLKQQFPASAEKQTNATPAAG